MSLPVAKNAMRRAIEDLYYRALTKAEKDRVWKYFNSRCAYCDKLIDRSLRHGHMDHLECEIPGGNYIRNRVLACKECNGNEKRERDWRLFLKSKCANRRVYEERKSKIIRWQNQFEELPPFTLSKEAQSAKIALDAAIKHFEREFNRFRTQLRALRH